jgi:hypothetical protein
MVSKSNPFESRSSLAKTVLGGTLNLPESGTASASGSLTISGNGYDFQCDSGAAVPITAEVEVPCNIVEALSYS